MVDKIMLVAAGLLFNTVISEPGFAEARVVKVPEHKQWCITQQAASLSQYETSDKQGEVYVRAEAAFVKLGREKELTTIGRPYVEDFKLDNEGAVSVVICADVPGFVEAEQDPIKLVVREAQDVLVYVCAEADVGPCHDALRARLKEMPYQFNDDQIDQLAWRETSVGTPGNLDSTIIAELTETTALPISEVRQEASGEPVQQYTIISIGLPTAP
jgi:hypothetical protein